MRRALGTAAGRTLVGQSVKRPAARSAHSLPPPIHLAELGQQLPALRVLNIGDNRLCPLTAEIALALQGTLANVRVLVVSGTPLSWPQVERLHLLAPHLEELHLCRCGVFPITTTPATWDPAAASVSSSEGSFIAADAFSTLKVSAVEA